MGKEPGAELNLEGFNIAPITKERQEDLETYIVGDNLPDDLIGLKVAVGRLFPIAESVDIYDHEEQENFYNMHFRDLLLLTESEDLRVVELAYIYISYYIQMGQISLSDLLGDPDSEKQKYMDLIDYIESFHIEYDYPSIVVYSLISSNILRGLLMQVDDVVERDMNLLMMVNYNLDLYQVLQDKGLFDKGSSVDPVYDYEVDCLMSVIDLIYLATREGDTSSKDKLFGKDVYSFYNNFILAAFQKVTDLDLIDAAVAIEEKVSTFVLFKKIIKILNTPDFYPIFIRLVKKLDITNSLNPLVIKPLMHRLTSAVSSST